MPSSYVLGNHFESFVRQQLDSGRYQSASEVIREGLRLLEAQEASAQEGFVQAGIDSGPGRPLSEVDAKLKSRYRYWADKGTPPGAL